MGDADADAVCPSKYGHGARGFVLSPTVSRRSSIHLPLSKCLTRIKQDQWHLSPLLLASLASLAPRTFSLWIPHPQRDHNLSITFTAPINSAYDCICLQQALCRSSNLLYGPRSIGAPNQPQQRASQPLQLPRRQLLASRVVASRWAGVPLHAQHINLYCYSSGSISALRCHSPQASPRWPPNSIDLPGKSTASPAAQPGTSNRVCWGRSR